MKNLVLLSVTVFMIFGCSNQGKKQQEFAAQPVVVLTVDELYGKAAELADKEVVVKGTVSHVCKEGGERCFLMGSNENIVIRVEAGEKIGSFKQEQMGSELEVVGVLREVKTEAQAHNPGAEHGEGEETIDSARAAAHKIIAEAQDSAVVVYFIEGMTVKELQLETK